MTDEDACPWAPQASQVVEETPGAGAGAPQEIPWGAVAAVLVLGALAALLAR